MSEAVYLSEEAERRVIAATMSPGATEAMVVERADLEPGDFFGLHRRVIWQTLLTLRREGKLVDDKAGTTVVTDAFMAQIQPVRVEWEKCLDQLVGHANVEHYAAIIRKHALSRRVLTVCGDTVERHRMGQEAGDELLSTASAALQRLARTSHNGRTRTMTEMLKVRFEELDKQQKALAQGGVAITGVPTGIEQLDQFTGGIQPGIVTLLAGRPGMGKSALAQSITAHALDMGHGVHVFSFEDLGRSYVDRMLSRKSRVPVQKIRTGTLEPADMARLTGEAGQMARWHRFGYEDVESATAADIIGAVRRERDRLETALVVVDYITLLKKPHGVHDAQEAIDENITQLGLAARHDNLAYLVLAQLNRKVEQRPDKRPMLADLRGAGELEERAKCVLAVYRESYYNHDAEDRSAMEILVLKNNDGPENVKVNCRWDGACTRIH